MGALDPLWTTFSCVLFSFIFFSYYFYQWSWGDSALISLNFPNLSGHIVIVLTLRLIVVTRRSYFLCFLGFTAASFKTEILSVFPFLLALKKVGNEHQIARQVMSHYLQNRLLF